MLELSKITDIIHTNDPHITSLFMYDKCVLIRNGKFLFVGGVIGCNNAVVIAVL